jgi:hypothetical protein
LKINAYKASLLEGNHEAIATNDAMLRCPAAFVRDLQTFFGENEDGLKSLRESQHFRAKSIRLCVDEYPKSIRILRDFRVLTQTLKPVPFREERRTSGAKAHLPHGRGQVEILD